jgi:hypothetical protein
MKAHVISDHVTVIEDESNTVVNPYTIVVDGVEVSSHLMETVAIDRAKDYQLVYKIATSNK